MAIIDRIKSAHQAALTAFWAEVAKQYPEVKSGDVPPDELLRFSASVEDVIGSWLSHNGDLLTNPWYDKLTALGFVLGDTGGGCTAWMLTSKRDGACMMITRNDSGTGSFSEWDLIDAGLYDAQGEPTPDGLVTSYIDEAFSRIESFAKEAAIEPEKAADHLPRLSNKDGAYSW